MIEARLVVVSRGSGKRWVGGAGREAGEKRLVGYYTQGAGTARTLMVDCRCRRVFAVICPRCFRTTWCRRRYVRLEGVTA